MKYQIFSNSLQNIVIHNTGLALQNKFTSMVDTRGLTDSASLKIITHNGPTVGTISDLKLFWAVYIISRFMGSNKSILVLNLECWALCEDIGETRRRYNGTALYWLTSPYRKWNVSKMWSISAFASTVIALHCPNSQIMLPYRLG